MRIGPTSAGTSSLRASIPPRLRLVTTDIRLRSGRANWTPRETSRKPTAVGADMRA
jgi:hypothetical protein